MSWKFDDSTPIYIQLIELIKHMIVNGTYKEGEKLPAVRDLAIEAGVNPNTIQRAFSDLERQGLVKSDRTNGRYVTDDKDLIQNLREELSFKYVNELFFNLKELGMDEKKNKKLVNSWEVKE